jgi:subtilisin family serine protease
MALIRPARVSALVAALCLLAAAPSAAALEEGSASPPVAPGAVLLKDTVIVQWESGSPRSERVEARADAGVELQADLGDHDFQLVEVEPGQTRAVAIESLESDPAVVLAERNGYREPAALPNDPLFGELWGLRNTGAGIKGFSGAVAGDDIDVAGAWIRTLGSPSVVVADIDSGYRFDHPDLAPVAWVNPGEIDDGFDNDFNGYVDDIHGYDFVGANGEAIAPDNDPTDDDLFSGGHGVHTAGTIGAAGNNGVGITGVAQNVRIMPLRVCSRFPALSANRCPFSAIVEAINYAGDMGARVANMSLGGTVKSQAEVNALAANPGTLFVISAGNDGQDNEATHHYPCDFEPVADAAPAVPGAIDNVVCVAATNQADALAGFSDYGATSVDLGAPGTETLSTYPISEPFEEHFTVDDFSTEWPASGADGGFERTNESPLTSFGMTDVIGSPTPSTVRETTSSAFTLPPNQGCTLIQSRRVVVDTVGGDEFRYSVLLNGLLVSGATAIPTSTVGPGLENRTLDLPAAFKAGGPVQLRFRFTAGVGTDPGSGVWLDDLRIRCQVPTYAFLQGTSMATPHVSGTAALLFSQKPGASVSAVKQALLASVDPVASLSGKTTTGGRLDASSAMDLFDAVAPNPPSLSTDPASPADDAEPTIHGTAEERSTVRLYAGPNCEGAPLATLGAAALAAPGFAVSVPEEAVSEFSATATDTAAVPNVSACSAPLVYEEKTPEPPDEVAPAAPLLTSTSPVSPANDGSPRIAGTAEPGSTVRIYKGADCTGTQAATGSALELASPGIQVGVPAQTTAQFSATATDAALNVSPCSTPISYTNTATTGPITVIVIPGPEPPQPPGPVSCTVPKLAGKTVAQARSALLAAGCKLGKVTKPKPRKGQKLVVKRSTPGAGSASTVAVALKLGAKPKPRHH